MAGKKLALASISPDNFLQTKSNLKGKEQFTVQSRKRMSQDSGWPWFYFKRDHRPLHDMTITIKGSCIICNVFSNQNKLKLWLLECTLALDVNFQRSWMVLNSSKRGTFKPILTFPHIEIRFDPHLGVRVPQTFGTAVSLLCNCFYLVSLYLLIPGTRKAGLPASDSGTFPHITCALLPSLKGLESAWCLSNPLHSPLGVPQKL